MNKPPQIKSTDNWVNEFTEKLFPLDVKKRDIKDAFILKDSYLPTSIYKYREINENSIKNLKEDTIWLANPSNLNDPYDCYLTMDKFSIIEASAKENIKKILNKAAPLFGIDNETLKSILESNEPEVAFNAYVLRNDQKEIFEANKSYLSKNRSNFKKIYEDLIRKNSNEVSRCFKLCSFSARKDSMPMWAHYARNHEGFCIEYDIGSIPYLDHRRHHLYPVIYSKSMFDATEYYDMKIEDERRNSLYLFMAALVKAKDWEYEEEWRLVFSSGHLDKEQTYVMGKPKAIYLGSKIEPKYQDDLIKICDDKDIPRYKMKAHHNKFLMEPTEI